MNKTILGLTAAMALSVIPAVSRADDPPASPLSFNVSGTTDYRFRGISQSRLDPALQGGADYAFANGFYVGTWASTIHWIHDAGTIAGVDTGSAPVEMDFYGGYRGEIQKDFTYDVGLLQYYYPANHLSDVSGSFSPNTLEIYGALTYGPVTFKYSRSLTRLFGFADSKGSGYFEAAATIDLGEGYSLTPHIGYQKVAKNGAFSYTDVSLTASKDWFGLTFSLALVDTDAGEINGTPAYASPSGKNLGRFGGVFAVKKTF